MTDDVLVPLAQAGVLAALGLPLALRALPALERGLLGGARPSPPATWGVLPAVLGVVLYQAAATTGYALLLGPMGEGFVTELVATLLGLATGGLVALAAARRLVGGAVAPAVGLTGGPSGRPLRAGLYGGLGMALLAPLVFAGMFLAPALHALLGRELAPQDVLLGVLSLRGGELALAATLVVLGPALLEELLFRGLIQPLLVVHLGAAGGIAATALFFAALHGPDVVVQVFGLGLAFGALRHRSGSLAASCVAHALWNGGTLLTLLAFPELLEALTSAPPAQP